MERQGQGSGERRGEGGSEKGERGREGGRGKEKIRKYRNRRKDRRAVRWKEARGSAGWGGLQAWEGWPGSGGCEHWLCSLHCVGSWVWVHKPSRQKSAPLGNLPVCPRPSSPFGLCTRISSSTQGEYCSCPIRMRRNVSISPILPGSCQPHASSPGDKKGSLILSHSN